MRHRALMMFVLAFAVAGCRQSDGDVPQPQGEQANKAEDISRDLQGVASAERGALNDLRDDLGNLSGQAPPSHLVSELVARLSTALAGTTLTDEAAKQLADKLFVATTARDLSERQQTMVRSEVTGALTSLGVPQAKAEPVGQVVTEIQTAIGENRKRWWHWR
jgi:hypothetical protein